MIYERLSNNVACMFDNLIILVSRKKLYKHNMDYRGLYERSILIFKIDISD